MVNMNHEQLINREDVEKLLGYRIRTLSIYKQAMLHKSAVKVYNSCQSNERLEFIGDSVLNLVIAKYLYHKYPDEDEGFMTKIRTRIVSGRCLSVIAKQMGIHKHIRMNEKALRQGWNNNDRILEDTFEALVGAVYCDMGWFYANEFILTQMDTYLNDQNLLVDTNYKDILMRYTQQKAYTLPMYKVIHELGPNHNKYFVVAVSVNGYLLGEGCGVSKKKSEQNAACNAMKCLQINGV
jgi:ribonuclease-3